MMKKCYSVNRSWIDENNDSIRKSWIVFHPRIVAKLTSATEFSAIEDLAYPIKKQMPSSDCSFTYLTIIPTILMLVSLFIAVFLTFRHFARSYDFLLYFSLRHR